MTTLQFTAESFNAAYSRLAKELVFNSYIRQGRQKGAIYSIRGVEFILTNPRKCVCSLPFRNMSRKYAAGEYLLYQQATDAEEDYAAYSKTWCDLATGGVINSAYGARIFRENGEHWSKWEYCLQQLLSNPHTKNAIIDVRQPSDILPSQPDRCCTLYIAFRIEQEKLHMEVCMRSSDFWTGLPYDVFCFAQFMQQMMYEYNQQTTNYKVTLGTYTHRALDLHCYEKHFDRVKTFVQNSPGVNGVPPLSPINAYEFPVYDDYTRNEIGWLLDWEQRYRNGSFTNTDQFATELRDRKLHPYCETLGSWLLNKIKMMEYNVHAANMFALAEKTAQYSQCVDRKVGCVITDEDNSVHAEACNKVINCNQQCDDKLHRICCVDHAEVEALALFKAKYPRHVPKYAYVTLYPCLPCRIALQRAGVQHICVKGFSHKGAGGDITVELYDPEYM